MLLTTCISYVNHFKDFVDRKPRDPNFCTFPKVSCVKEMRSNALPNDLSTREQALESNMDPFYSSTHTLEQGGEYENINILTSLDPPYSPKTYLQHQSLCREDDIMNFIHDLSPHIEITKNELLDDEDVLPQSSKKGTFDKIKEIVISHDTPPSSTNPFLPPYTSDFKEIHDPVPPSSQLQHSYSHGFHIITKQGFKGQGIGKFEHGIHVPLNPSTKTTTRGLGSGTPLSMDEFLGLQNFKDYLQKQQLKRAHKNVSSSKHPFCSFHQTHDHYVDD